jgi:hypothetical protein
VDGWQVLLDEVALARHLCKVIEGIDPPGDPQIHRWRACVRQWARRGQINRYGRSARGERRYDLEEVMPVARQWLASHPDHPARRVVDG